MCAALNGMETSILYIEDDEDDYILTRQMLINRGAQKYQITWARSYEEGEARLQTGRYDAVLVDYDLGGQRTGIELVRKYSGTCPAPFILYTGRGSDEVDLEAMQAGATLYLTKNNFDTYTLKRFIRYAIERKQAEEDLKEAHQKAVWLARFPDENPNPVARVSMDGVVLYCNRTSADPAVWAFVTGSQVPPPFQPILNAVLEKGNQVDRDIPLGERFYSVTFMPFLRDQYINVYGHDITQRMQTEHALERSDLRLRETIRHAPTAIYSVDFVQRRFTEVNEQMVELTGYSREELLAINPMEILEEESQVRFQKRIQQWLRGEKPDETVEYRVKTKDGRTIYVVLHVTFTTDADGQPYGAMVIGHDVTERRRIEYAVRESEARYRDLTASIDDGYMELDQNWCFTFVNQRAASNVHVKPEDLIGKNIWDMYPRLHGTPIERNYRAVMQKRKPVDFEAKGIYSNAWYNVRVYPTSKGIAILWIDISERKHAEAALAATARQLSESESRFRTMADGTPVMMWVTGIEGETVFINHAYSVFFGVTLEQLQAGTWQVLVHPDDTESYVGEFLAATSARRPYRAQGRVRRYDGEWRWIDSHGQPRFADTGEYLGMAGSSLDITESKLAEAVREQLLNEIQHAYDDLANERNRLAAVLQSLPVGVSIQDNKGGVIERNQAYEEIWGNSIPQANSVEDYAAYQAWWADTGQPIQPEEWAAAIAVQKGQTVTGQLLRIQRFDGKHVFVLNSGAPIYNANGEIGGSVVAIMDVTRLTEAEYELAQSQERFRVALQSVPIMVYNCDRELRYTWVYQPFGGFTADNVLGKRDDELISPQAAAGLMKIKQQSIDSGEGGVHEVNVPADGVDRYYLLTTDPLRDRQGNVTGLVCSAIEITEQKRMQAERQEQSIRLEVQRRLMDQRELERGTIARDLHDGPMQILSGTLFSVQAIHDDFPDPILQRECDSIRDQIKHAIQELREAMKEMRPPALLNFSFVRLLESDAIEYRMRFPEVEIVLDVEDDGERLSQETRLALYRIYQAGVSNIIRHADADKVWVSFQIKGDQFCFELKDNGTGFAMGKDLAQMVNEGRFGLVSMKERAEAIGGQLVITAEQDLGTVIQVKGPVRRNAGQENSCSSEQ